MLTRTATGNATIFDIIDANIVEYRYLTAAKTPTPSVLNTRDPSTGLFIWSTTIPVATGSDIVWVIVATIDPNNQLVGVWSTPAQFSGRSAIHGVITNSAVVVATNKDGTDGDYSNIGGTFELYDGTTLIDPTTVVFSSINEVGIDLNINTSGVYSVGAVGMTNDTASCTLQAVYQGLTIQLIYSISRSKQGLTGLPAENWYLKPTNGTAIKNSSGSLIIEARHVTGSTDILASGNYKIYVNGTVLIGSEYTRSFNAAAINGSLLVELKNGTTLIDTLTLIDITDGSNATIGSINSNNGLVFSRDTNSVWTPVATTTTLTANFYKAGSLVSTNSVVITRTGSTISSNSGSVSNATSIGDGGSNVTVTFTDAASGINVSESVFIVQDGLVGPAGPNGLSTRLDLAYAVNSSGGNANYPTAGSSASAVGKTYMGTNIVSWTPPASGPISTTAADYEWTLMQGANGSPGLSNRVDFAYSDSNNGVGNLKLPTGTLATTYTPATPATTTQYMGSNVVTWSTGGNEPAVSSILTEYEWVKVKGNTGSTGNPAPEKYSWVVYSDSMTTGIISTNKKGTSPDYIYSGIRHNNLTVTPSSADLLDHTLFDWYISTDVIDLSNNTMFLNTLNAQNIDVTSVFAQDVTASGVITGGTINAGTFTVGSDTGFKTVMDQTGSPLTITNNGVFTFGINPAGDLKIGGTLESGIINDINLFSQPVLDLLINSGTSNTGTGSSTGGSPPALTDSTLSGISSNSTSLTIVSPNTTDVNISVNITDHASRVVGAYTAPVWNIVIRRDSTAGAIISNTTQTGSSSQELISIINGTKNYVYTLFLDKTVNIIDTTPEAGTGKYVVIINRTSGDYNTPLIKKFSIAQTVIGGTAATYTHPTYNTRSLTNTGAQVINSFTSDSTGHVTGVTYKTLTPANISAGGLSTSNAWTNSNSYTETQVQQFVVPATQTIATTPNNNNGLTVYQVGGSGDAFMTFHIAGDYALRFGLNGTTNKLSVGGWSMGQATYALYHEGNKPTHVDVQAMSANNSNISGDLNSIFDAGSYRVESSAINAPTADFYALVVFGNESNVTCQIATHFSNGQMYSRNFNNTWSAWRKVYDSINKPTAADIGKAVDSSKLNGIVETTASTPNTVVKRNGAGDMIARLFRSEYGTTNGNIQYIMTQVNFTSDNYIRPSTPAQFRASVTDGYYATTNTTYSNGSGILLSGTVFSADFGVGSTQVARGNHTHSYDNYGNWLLQINSGAATAVYSGNAVNFIAGTNVSLTKTGNAITVSSTDTNTQYSAGTALSLSGTQFNVNLGTGASQAAYGNHNHDGVYGSLAGVNYWQNAQYPSVTGGGALGNINFRWGLVYGVTGNFSGNVTAADHIATSDSRVKDNQKVIEDASYKRSKLTGKTFNRTDMHDRLHAGIIAQDLEGVFDEALFFVGDEKLGKKYCVSNTALIGLLIESANEDRKIIDKQQAQIDKLTKLVEGLIK